MWLKLAVSFQIMDSKYQHFTHTAPKKALPQFYPYYPKYFPPSSYNVLRSKCALWLKLLPQKIRIEVWLIRFIGWTMHSNLTSHFWPLAKPFVKYVCTHIFLTLGFTYNQGLFMVLPINIRLYKRVLQNKQ